MFEPKFWAAPEAAVAAVLLVLDTVEDVEDPEILSHVSLHNAKHRR